MARMIKTRVPGIYKRGSRFVVVVTFRGKQTKRSCDTMTEAIAVQQALKTDLRRGEYPVTTRTRFGEYESHWVEHYRGSTTRGFRASTRTTYREDLRRATQYFDEIRRLRLEEIEPGDVRDYVDWLFNEEAQGCTLRPATVRKHLAPLKLLFATAVEDRRLRWNPAAGVRVFTPTTGDDDMPEQRRAMTVSELNRLITALPEEWRLFFTFLAHTGVRISEAIEVRWGDIRPGSPAVLHVERQYYEGVIRRPKSRAGTRRIALSAQLSAGLEKRRGGRDQLVFTTFTGERLRPSNVHARVLKPAASKAKVDGVSFHTFRHTCASMLWKRHHDVKRIQTQLGHDDPGFTLRVYIHGIDEELQSVDFLDDWVDPDGEADAA